MYSFFWRHWRLGSITSNPGVFRPCLIFFLDKLSQVQLPVRQSFLTLISLDLFCARLPSPASGRARSLSLNTLESPVWVRPRMFYVEQIDTYPFDLLSRGLWQRHQE